jgi:hypothetical protein
MSLTYKISKPLLEPPPELSLEPPLELMLEIDTLLEPLLEPPA